MPAFAHHLFVCGNRRSCDHPRGCCDPDGNNALRNALKAAVKARDLGPLVRVNSSGCLDQCECGPTVVIYPQAIWYGNVQLSDISRIVESLVTGEVLSDLLIPDDRLNTQKRGSPSSNDRGRGIP